MKRILKLLLVTIFIFLISFQVQAKEKVTLYFFYGDGCPHCAEEEKVLLPELEKDKDLKIVKLETWYNEENMKLLDKVNTAYNLNSRGVPCNIIGDTAISGYNEYNANKIKRAIAYYKENNYVDNIEKIKNNEKVTINDKFDKEEDKTDKENTIDVPLIGKFNVKNVSISTAAVLIGLVDGFNPCAMWVLLFLISTLIGMKDRKKMLILGFTFLLTSGLVYFIIMFSWLNIVVSVSTSIIFRTLIAIFAVGAGIYNLYNYYKSLKEDDGCEVVSKEKRKTIFKRIRKFTHEKRFIIAILGIMALAISVNIIELLCSAGLPVVFSELLAINNISGTKAILYNLLYIIFFMLDDIVVFLLAVKTMDVVGFSTKYNKYSHLIGGLIMLSIGLLLILKPEWLMFNFK